MKTITKSVIAEESGLNINDGKNKIFRIIDNQINNLKVQFLSDWERGHSISSEEKDQKIDKLRLMQENLRDFLNGIDSDDAQVNFTLNLDIKLTSKNQKEITEEKLLVASM